MAKTLMAHSVALATLVAFQIARTNSAVQMAAAECVIPAPKILSALPTVSASLRPANHNATIANVVRMGVVVFVEAALRGKCAT